MLLSLIFLTGLRLVASVGDTSAHAGRETISFNFAWRWRRDAAVPAAAASCPSLVPHEALQCPGLSKRRCAQNEFTFPQDPPTGSCNDTSTATECEMDCCADPACGLWAYKMTSDGSNRCWWSAGLNTSRCSKSEGWVGGKRSIPGPRSGPPTLVPASVDYDDSGWEGIDVPHDARLTEEFDLNLFRGPGKLRFSSSWYRKKFRVPEDWSNRPLFLTFEGVMRAAQVFLNGVLIGTHEVGYTAFTLRLDSTGLLQEGNSSNLIAVFADNRFSSWDGTGWWYNGAGVYRDVTLTSFATPLHLAVDGGVFAVPSIPAPESTISMHQDGNGTAGLWAKMAYLNVTLEVVQDALAGFTHGAVVTASTVVMQVIDQAGKVCANESVPLPTSASANRTMSHVMDIANAELWSVPRPYVHTLYVQIKSSGGDIIDAVNTSVGIRSAQFRMDDGLHVNEQRVRLRGFCNHNDFTGRINHPAQLSIILSNRMSVVLSPA